MFDQAAGTQIVALVEPQSIVAALNGAAFDLNPYTGLVRVTQGVSVVSGAVSGKLQHSANGSTNWTDVIDGAFAAIADVGFQTLLLNLRSLRRYIRWINADAGFNAFILVSATLTPIRQ